MPDFEDNKHGLLFVDHSAQFKQQMEFVPVQNKKPKKIPKKLLAPLNAYGPPIINNTKSVGKTRLPDISKKMSHALKIKPKSSGESFGKHALPPKPTIRGSQSFANQNRVQFTKEANQMMNEYVETNQTYEDNEEDQDQSEHTQKQQQASNPHLMQGRMQLSKTYQSAQGGKQLKIQYEPTVIEVNNKIKKKYLIFRSYDDPIQIRPYLPPDRGYFFDMRNCDIKIIRFTLEDNGFRELPTAKEVFQNCKNQPSAVVGANLQGIVSKEMLKQQASIIWYISSIKNQVYQTLQRYQKINHFPSSFYVTRKDLMYKNIAKLSEIHGYKHFSFLPKTYILPNEFGYLQQAMKQEPGRQWIFKPAANSQGRGIFVTDKIEEIDQKTISSSSNYVVCEYISNPLLMNGYKFDMRVYVAITSIDPLRIYVFEEGLARFATCKYEQTNATQGGTGGTKNKFMHLTNYSINKKNSVFEKEINDGEGYKWSHTALKKMMKQMGIDEKAIWKQIEDIVIKTVISGEYHMKQACDQYVPFSSNCFELLGFDILIDDALQCWLIEVNLSPSLGCDLSLDQKIKSHLIADLFTLIGIVPLTQRKLGPNDQKFSKLNGIFGGQKGDMRTQNKLYGEQKYGGVPMNNTQ